MCPTGRAAPGASVAKAAQSRNPRLLRSAPYFPIADLDRASRHYEEVLGFERVYTGGDPPVFAICVRDEQTVMLRLVSEPGRIVPNERQGGTWDVSTHRPWRPSTR